MLDLDAQRAAIDAALELAECAGAAALEAAFHRRFGLTLDLAEEYIFHMGKAFALNRTAAGGPVTQPVENNSSLVGFQAQVTSRKSLRRTQCLTKSWPPTSRARLRSPASCPSLVMQA
jgi:hypothetical protein